MRGRGERDGSSQRRTGRPSCPGAVVGRRPRGTRRAIAGKHSAISRRAPATTARESVDACGDHAQSHSKASSIPARAWADDQCGAQCSRARSSARNASHGIPACGSASAAASRRSSSAASAGDHGTAAAGSRLSHRRPMSTRHSCAERDSRAGELSTMQARMANSAGFGNAGLRGHNEAVGRVPRDRCGNGTLRAPIRGPLEQSAVAFVPRRDLAWLVTGPSTRSPSSSRST